jgi:DNA-binding GntR family transcriptional regulator
MTTYRASEGHILLGVGEYVAARLPTPDEQAALDIEPDTPVLVVNHTDRDPDVIPADDVTVWARLYGVVLP